MLKAELWPLKVKYMWHLALPRSSHIDFIQFMDMAVFFLNLAQLRPRSALWEATWRNHEVPWNQDWGQKFMEWIWMVNLPISIHVWYINLPTFDWFFNGKLVGKWFTVHGWYGFPKCIKGWTAGFEMSILWPSPATSKLFFIRKARLIGPYHSKKKRRGGDDCLINIK